MDRTTIRNSRLPWPLCDLLLPQKRGSTRHTERPRDVGGRHTYLKGPGWRTPVEVSTVRGFGSRTSRSTGRRGSPVFEGHRTRTRQSNTSQRPLNGGKLTERDHGISHVKSHSRWWLWRHNRSFGAGTAEVVRGLESSSEEEPITVKEHSRYEP